MYDVSVGFQLSALRPAYTQVEQFYQIMPWRATETGEAIWPADHPDFGVDTYDRGQFVLEHRYKNAADVTVTGKNVMFNYETINWRNTGTCSITNGVVTFAAAVDNASFQPGSRLKIGSTWYDIVDRDTSTHALLDDLTVNAVAGTAYELHAPVYAPTDPTKTSLTWAVKDLGYFAEAMSEHAHRYWQNGAKIGIYGEILTHQNGRIQHLISDGHPDAWKDWLDDFNSTAKRKVYNGMSLIEVINSFNGAIYPPWYLETTFSSASNQERFRKGMRVLNYALRDAGADTVIPLLLPVYQNAQTTPVPAGFIADSVADCNAIAQDEWGVWANTGQVALHPTLDDELP